MKATFLKGVVLGAAVAMVTLVGSAAVAWTGVGKVFNLGESNRANARSQLEGATSSAVLNVTNTDKSATASGVSIDVPSNVPPLVVNSAIKVKNLNADLLDGQSASQFQSATTQACANGTAISSIAPNGAATCNGPTVLPLNIAVAPDASSGVLAFAPSSLGMFFQCITGVVPDAAMLVEDRGPSPASVNYSLEVNNAAPIVGNSTITSAPNSKVQLDGPPHSISQIEYLDSTTVTTINISLFVVTVDGNIEGCEYQGTISIARRTS